MAPTTKPTPSSSSRTDERAANEAMYDGPTASIDVFAPTDVPDRAATQSTLKPWMSFDFHVHKWLDLLVAIGCDEAPIQELFLLSQANKEGNIEANCIIGKILKKRTDRLAFRNASAFVQN